MHTHTFTHTYKRTHTHMHTLTVAGYLTRSLRVSVEVEVFHPGRWVCVRVFTSFDMQQRQWRRCHLLHGHVGWQLLSSFDLLYRWQWPTADLAGIDIFTHCPGADQQDSEEAVFAGQNSGCPTVNGQGILHTPLSSHCTPSWSFLPFRHLDPHPFFVYTRFDDGIILTPHISIRLPSPSSLRRSNSFPTRSGPPPEASSTSVSRSSHPNDGVYPLSFSTLPHLQLSPSSPHRRPSHSFPPPPIPACTSILVFLTFDESYTVFCAMSFLSWHCLSLCVFG